MKKKRGRSFIVIFYIFCLFLLPIAKIIAQELKGRVTDGNHKPVYRAHIQLFRGGKERYKTFTDKDGVYEIWPCIIGAYQALITIEGEEKILQNIEIKARDTARIDFELRRKRGKLN